MSASETAVRHLLKEVVGNYLVADAWCSSDLHPSAVKVVDVRLCTCPECHQAYRAFLTRCQNSVDTPVPSP